MMDYKIISVESRKGGVGKTTAALNLSKLLVDSGYSVLLIDLDITGTNINDVVTDSTFWKKFINPVKCLNKKTKKNENANLLQIFHKLFLTGEEFDLWGKSDITNKGKIINFSSDRINILGSQIFDFTKNDDGNGKIKLVCNPSILFDELHTFWFVEYLQKLSESFSNQVKKEKEDIIRKGIAIVLDNSPGYIGINPAIQEWLTDIGPIRGKFLTISSLDKQDIFSCRYSIEDLHTLYNEKHKGWSKYIENKNVNDNNENTEFDLSGESKKFYMRIVSNSLNEDVKNYYDPSVNTITSFPAPPEFYQAIIINKVPEVIKYGSLLYNYDKIRDSIGEESIINKLLCNSDKDITANMVFYNEYVYYQFIESSLCRKRYDNQNLSTLNNYFKRLEKTISHNSNNNSDIRISKNKHFEYDRNIKFLQQKLNLLFERLIISGYRHIVDLIHKEWNPEAPFESLRNNFNELFSEFVFDYYVNDEDDNSLAKIKEIDSFLENLLNNLEENNIELQKLMTFDKYLVFNAYKSLVYITIKSQIPNKDLIYQYNILISDILRLQINRYSKFCNLIKNNDYSFIDFIRTEKIDIENDINREEISKIVKNKNYQSRSIERAFVEYYNSFCIAQARLIDLDSDFSFLIKVLKQITINAENKDQETIFPYIEEVLNNVIIYKTPNYPAKEKLVEGFQSASYMLEFQDVLRKIISKWNLV
jgi:hypothetical protein